MRNANGHTKINNILMTKDYSRFSFLKENRQIRPSHVRNLSKSLSDKQIGIPIVVDSNYKIYEGQHRFEACKKLGLPVYFMIIEDLDIKDVQKLNENMAKWSPNDYLNCYLSQGYSSYVKYDNFREKYGFTHNETLTLLYDGKNPLYTGASSDFRNGILKIKNLRQSCMWAEKILQTQQYFEHCKKRFFVFAMVVCFNNKEYSHEIFVKKLSTQSSRMNKQVSVADYLKNIELIYNYRNSKKIRLFTY